MKAFVDHDIYWTRSGFIRYSTSFDSVRGHFITIIGRSSLQQSTLQREIKKLHLPIGQTPLQIQTRPVNGLKRLRSSL